MKADTYNRVSAGFLAAAVLSAFAFDAWPGARGFALALGVSSGVGAIALYARNRVIAKRLTASVEVQTEWKRLEEALSEGHTVVMHHYLHDLAIWLEAEAREQEDRDSENLERLLWHRRRHPSELERARHTQVARSKDLCHVA